MKSVAFYTLGCKVNQYDTEAMLELFKDHGYDIVEYEDYADVYIINTCTVTHMGDRKSRQMIRRALKSNSDAVIAVVGCYAQTAPLEIAGISGVGVIVGTKDRLKIVDLVEEYAQKRIQINAVQKLDRNEGFEELNIADQNEQTRAYLKIQEGCNQYCSYCIIPFARGPIRSREPNNVVEEVKKLVKNGYKEVILTGIHVASYGEDLEEEIDLYEIINKVHDVDGVERIRISSIEPRIFTDQFVNNLKNLPKLCPHFHISLQSGCNATLKRMNRKYTAHEYKAVCERVRKELPDVAITTDVMVGFPGETEEEFLETYRFLEDIAFAQTHVFKYSQRKGTPAARWEDQVEPSIKEARSKKLLALAEEKEIAFIDRFIGQSMEVLIEEESDTSLYEGYTNNYIRVIVSGEKNLKNKIVSVKLKQRKGLKVIGEIIK